MIDFQLDADGDLAIDPTLLLDEPTLEEVMFGAGFQLGEQPGIWQVAIDVDGAEVVIPVDLIVPEAMTSGAGRRGARLGVHGKQAARRAVGLEAAMVDHSPITVEAMEPRDVRAVVVEVAGFAALLVAKMHKIRHRRRGRPNRLSDKDAADVYRIMQVASPDEVAMTLDQLCRHAMAADATKQALSYLDELFGRRAGGGVTLAQRALRGSVDETSVATLCVSFTERVISSLQ